MTPKVKTLAALLLIGLLCALVYAFQEDSETRSQEHNLTGPVYTPTLSYWIPRRTSAFDNTPWSGKNIAWERLKPGEDSLGYVDGPVWFRTRVINTHRDNLNRLIVISAPYLDHLNIYLLHSDHLLKIWRLGDSLPFSARPIKHPFFLLPLTVPAHSSISIYAYVSNKGTATLPLSLWKPDAFYAQDLKERFLAVVAIGFLLFAALFSCISALIFRHLMYLCYSLFLVSAALIQGSLQGLPFELFWPNVPLLNHISLIATPLALVFLLAFTRYFFRTGKSLPIFDRILQVSILIFVCVPLLLGIFFGLTWSKLFVSYSGVATVIMLAFAGTILWTRRVTGAGFYSVSMIAILVGGIIGLLRAEGILAVNVYTKSSIALGSALQSLILSLGILVRMYVERTERLRAQAALIQLQKKRVELERMRVHDATHNPITSLPNRSYLFMWLEDYIKNVPRTPFILCFIKLHNYQKIVPLLGESRTKDLMSAYSSWLEAKLKSSFGELVVPVGHETECNLISVDNDIFGFILEERPGTHDLLEQFLTQIDTPYDYDEMHLGWRPQLSYICYPSNESNAVALVEKALFGFSQGGGTIAKFDEGNDKLREQKLLLILELKDSIANGHFNLEFQPQVSLRTGKVVGVEALVRWLQPNLGRISPGLFVPYAEEIGLIGSLTRWVAREAIAALSTLRSNGWDDIQLSFNVSTKDIMHRDWLPGLIADELAQRNIPARQLCVEITETAAMEDLETITDVLKQMQSMGLRIALDDFGAGYSSLAAIQGVPLNELKIDRGFVDGVSLSNKTQDLLKGAISMGKSLGFAVVAEGVETHQDYVWLEASECDIAQGFFIARPMHLENLFLWMDQRRGYFVTGSNR